MISMWLKILGVVLFFVIGVMLVKKPTHSKSPAGHFDNPAHTKPLFKIATLLILGFFTSVLVIS